MSERRTKRRYAHELYPHDEEGGVRTLEVEVPYLYAIAVGSEIRGTGWFDVQPRALAGERVGALTRARQIALLADALAQDLVGQEAWAWADERLADETGEIVGDRAAFYGVDWTAIKPYPCGPEPERHDHLGEPDRRGFSVVTSIPLRESECTECTEPIEVSA